MVEEAIRCTVCQHRQDWAGSEISSCTKCGNILPRDRHPGEMVEIEMPSGEKIWCPRDMVPIEMPDRGRIRCPLDRLAEKLPSTGIWVGLIASLYVVYGPPLPPTGAPFQVSLLVGLTIGIALARCLRRDAAASKIVLIRTVEEY